MSTHQLARKYSFWLSSTKDTKVDMSNYEETLKKIGTLATVEDFWAIYQHMVRPEQLPEGTQFLLFQDSVRPVWEDPNNNGGGRIVLRIKRPHGNKFWEDFMLSYIGEQLMNVKKNFVMISIWIKAAPLSVQGTIQNWISNTLGFKEKKEFKYEAHPMETKEKEVK